jgi:hypothetical protein
MLKSLSVCLALIISAPAMADHAVPVEITGSPGIDGSGVIEAAGIVQLMFRAKHRRMVSRFVHRPLPRIRFGSAMSAQARLTTYPTLSFNPAPVTQHHWGIGHPALSRFTLKIRA